MTTSADWALQKAIYQALINDTALTTLLGGSNVFDDVPQGTPYPCVTLGPSLMRDWSTGSESGSEHVLILHAWSRAGGKKEAQAILARVRAALTQAPISLEDHHLVNLLHEVSEVRLDPDGETYHGIVRLRAVTEPSV